MKNDSIDKIVSYFAAMTTEPFTYKGKVFKPKVLQVSPLLLRGLKCPAMCGGCCSRFSLDYLPGEDKPYDMAARYIEFNGGLVRVFSDLQQDHDDPKCFHLNKTNGRCRIHTRHPFSCDFEIIRFFTFADSLHANRVASQFYGRGWNMMRIDGERGALCEMLPSNPVIIADIVRKFKRLDRWMTHFRLKSKVRDVLDWVEDNKDKDVNAIDMGYV